MFVEIQAHDMRLRCRRTDSAPVTHDAVCLHPDTSHVETPLGSKESRTQLSSL